MNTIAAVMKYPGLNQYWPTMEEVSNCIGTEAEALPDAVLVAVHQPTRLLKRPFGGTDTGVECTEADLLAFVLDQLKPEGYLLAPITGPSGAGKSHVVRWLEIRLKNHPRAEAFHVIRIPKSASLRTVMEAILQPVAHEKEYADLLSEVANAESALPAEAAAALFGTMLQLSLRAKAQHWSAQTDVRIEGFGSQSLVGHAKQLADFLQDPVIAPHYLETVYPRLLKRALRGRVHDAQDADRAPQFEIDDLILPTTVQLSEASRGAQTYYRTRLERSDGRSAALATLNAVLDSAVAGVFKLGQQTHGKTLQDIMREIREALYRKKRELVLLVEDFYALTGIQESLLALSIQGVNDAAKPLCPMRTILAMTDGTLVGRDTIATRSEFEWVVVTEDPDEEKVVDNVVELTGRYLNAARIGRVRLMDNYEPAQGSVRTDFEPDADDDESSKWRTQFGASKQGVPLFPLSRSAIHFLARKHLVDSGRMRFNPRRALQRIVRDVLLAREFFEKGTFPAGVAIEDALSVELATVLRRVTSTTQKEQYRRLIVCWGNSPADMTELRRIPEGVYNAFGLPLLPDAGMPGAGALPPIPPPSNKREPASGEHPGVLTPPVAPAPLPVPAPVQVNPTAAITDKWRPLLDNWVGDRNIVQPDANNLRKIIRDHLVAYVDFNALALSAKMVDVQSIDVVRALGHDRKHRIERPVIRVAGPNGTMPDGEFARELLGLIRLHHMKGSLDYPDAAVDLVHVAGFLERNGQALETAILKAAELKLEVLAQAAVKSASLRMVVPATASLQEKMVAALSTSDVQPVVSGSAPWDELRLDCWTQREELRKAFLRTCGIFQGETGQTPFGVDASRFERAIQGPSHDAVAITARLEGDSEILEPLRKLLPKLTRTRLSIPVKEAVKLPVECRALMTNAGLSGKGAVNLCDEAQTLINDAHKRLWPVDVPGKSTVPDFHSLTALITAMRAVNWEDLTSLCKALADQKVEADTTRSIELLARINWSDLKAVVAFAKDYDAFTKGLDKALRAQETVFGTSDTTTAIEAIAQELDSLAQGLAVLKEAP
ncbi:protein DpdH [Variovorax sp. J22R133]|uniref:protein DpdH n=1 Tax=Variovorax brevis TaxID=3053503 RepID=UPI002574AC9F|nr:protein DpdH [Variovorax sp. J22R133]MDM0115662.1 protein DpdH [Variovorax sp. J22R133]